jgi:hypothetical protein
MSAVKVYTTLGQGPAEATPSTRWHAVPAFSRLSAVWLHLLEAWRADGS